MEKSTRSEQTPDHTSKKPLLLAVSLGFSLYWTCFFTMLMRNSFLDGDIEKLWYHLILRIAFFVGMGAVCLLALFRSDRMAGERGHRILAGGVCLFPLVAAISSLTAFSFGLTLPLAFDLIAWGLAGVGLACLLFFWIELLSAFEKPFVSQSLAASVVLGATAYLVVNVLPFPFNMVLLCAAPLLSLGLVRMLEREEDVVFPAFTSFAESKQHVPPALSYAAVFLVYGVVFGLGIGSTTQFAGGEYLIASIAFFLLLGALVAHFFLKHFSSHVRQHEVMRVMFPVLVAALIPMSFLQGAAYMACNLLILSSYICFEIISLDSELWLASTYRASSFYAVAMAQSTLYLGLALGHAIGLFATITGVANYAMLSTAALVLVVVLAVFVTFAPLQPVPGNDKPTDAESDAQQEPGRWKTRCAAVAKDAGLSARETEVFFLLAKGRGIEHIQNKLFISGHTVKTHTYNIYKKMGINSREELLDAIEAADPAEKADLIPQV
ncbi:MAG: helix-turn-helix transcriptional regulator [Raoultibacter sp.]